MLESIIAYLSRVLAGLVTGIDVTEWNSLNDFARYANAYNVIEMFLYVLIVVDLAVFAVISIVSLVKGYREFKALNSTEEES